jgi:hypothetical protein
MEYALTLPAGLDVHVVEALDPCTLARARVDGVGSREAHDGLAAGGAHDEGQDEDPVRYQGVERRLAGAEIASGAHWWYEREPSVEERVMPPRASSTKTAKRSAPAPGDVETFLASLDHPFKREILAVRQILLGADPGITEGIKWNAPSFRTSEYFATFHLRARDGVQVILHLGAKKRAESASGVAIADPESLLEWLAKDRASVKFRDAKDIDAKRAAFTNVVRRWIEHV